jgi:hypothetical protein
MNNFLQPEHKIQYPEQSATVFKRQISFSPPSISKLANKNNRTTYRRRNGIPQFLNGHCLWVAFAVIVLQAVAGTTNHGHFYVHVQWRGRQWSLIAAAAVGSAGVMARHIIG